MRCARRAAPAPRLRSATPADLAFLDRLRRQDSKALGFLSRSALAEKVRLGLVRVATVGGRAAGFLLHGSMRRPEVRVFQLAVDPAHRGRGVGRRLVGELVARSAAAGARGLSLRCRQELSANAFWHAAGFELHALEPARRGALFVWVRRVGGSEEGRPTARGETDERGVGGGCRVTACQHGPRGRAEPFRFHSRWHPCPRCGRITCDTWSAGGVRRRVCGACAERSDTGRGADVKPGGRRRHDTPS